MRLQAPHAKDTGSIRLITFALAFVLSPLLLRSLLLVEFDLDWRLIDLRGLLADLGVALLLAAISAISTRMSRILPVIVVLAWVALTIAGYEYTRVFDTVGTLTYAQYILDPTFFLGSALSFTHPFLFSSIFVAAGLGAWWGAKVKTAPLPATIVAVSLSTIVVALVLWPTENDAPIWRQSNVVLVNTETWLTSLGQRFSEPHVMETQRSDETEPTTSTLPDLGGLPLTQVNQSGKNVLLILLEGVSAGYLPSVAARQGVQYSLRMQRLDAYARDSISYSLFLTEQRQTNRGEYAVLCGDHPKLTSGVAKMTEAAQGTDRKCLPEILTDGGYRTLYVQAAPLAFMFKDRFMKNIGFQRIVGDTWFEQGYARNRWGVDDRAFFQQSHRLIEELREQPEPWFATMLTVGTHHPYVVPQHAQLAKGDEKFAQAIQWLDVGIGEFLDWLEEEGVLDDTLVLITSDESAGLTKGTKGLTRKLGQNWGFVVALTPLRDRVAVDELFVQSDLSISILDYVGLRGKGSHYVGRSIFRSYDRPRTVYFGNTFLKQVGALSSDGVLDLCKENLTDCSSFRVDPGRLFTANAQQVPWDNTRSASLRQAVEANNRTISTASEKASYPLIGDRRIPLVDTAGAQYIFGGQYLSVPARSRVSVTLHLEITGDNGVVSVSHHLNRRSEFFYRPKVGMIRSGDDLFLRYSYVFDEPITDLETELYLIKLLGEQPVLLIKQAQLSIEPLAADEVGQTGLQVHDIRITRGDAPRTMRFTAAQDTHFSLGKCVQRRADALLAHNCPEGPMLYGPFTFAPQGSVAAVNYRIESSQKDITVRSTLLSNAGRTIHGRSEYFTAHPGQSTQMRHQATLRQPVDDLIVVLESVRGGQEHDFVIHEATLEVIDSGFETSANLPPEASR